MPWSMVRRAFYRLPSRAPSPFPIPYLTQNPSFLECIPVGLPPSTVRFRLYLAVDRDAEVEALFPASSSTHRRANSVAVSKAAKIAGATCALLLSSPLLVL